MGKRGPQRRYRKDRPISSKDYSHLSLLITTDQQQEAYDQLKSYPVALRGEMLVILEHMRTHTLSGDVDWLALFFITDQQREAGKWFMSFGLEERGKLLLLLWELWQEEQVRILDIALER